MPTARASRVASALVVGVMVVGPVAACGSSSSGGSSSTATTARVGGTTTCSVPTIGAAVVAQGKSEKTQAVLVPGSVKCSDGWATAAANVGPAQQQVTETLIFEAEGQFWIPKDRANACKKPSPVPSDIYELACLSD